MTLLRPILPSCIAAAILLLSACGGGGGGGQGLDEEEPIDLGDTTRYTFDESSGSVALNAEFDYLHGTVSAASRVTGVSGNALNFGATSGSHVLFDICCETDAQWPVIVNFPDNTLTLAAWLMPTSMAADTLYPIFGGSDFGVQSIRLVLNDQRVQLFLHPQNNGDPVLVVQSASDLVNGGWQHIAVTYDGTTAILYLDGVEDARANITMPIQDVVNDYFIGGIPTGLLLEGQASFPGVIDEFIFSMLEYTPEQIATLAQ